MISVRRIEIGEGKLYKKIRLASLSESPNAFSTTLESANRRRLESWHEQADGTAAGRDRVTFFAFSDDNKDWGEVLQFWVDPAQRGGTVAGRLIEEIFSWAKKQAFKRLCAWVTKENGRAIRFYRQYGIALTDNTKQLRPDSDLVSIFMTKEIRLE